MKYISSLLVCMFILLSFSCSTEKNKKKTGFPKVKSLIASELSYEAIIRPTDIFVIKDKIILVSSYAQDYYCFIFQKQNLMLLAKTVIKGEGPNEIIVMGNASISQDEKKMYILDNAKKTLFVMDIDSATYTPDYKPREYFKLPMDELNPIFSIVCLNDSLFAMTGFNSGKYLITMVNNKGRVVNNIGNLPFSISDRYNPYVIYDHKAAIHPSLEKYAVVFKSYDKLIGIDSTGNQLFEINGIDDIKPKSNTNWVDPDKQINAYFNVVSDSNYIYCLYSGQAQAIPAGNTYRGLYCYKLNIFDWQGNPVIQLNLDKELYAFDVDAKEGIIYGLTPATESQLVAYKFR